ncbi:hypothetical protein [Rubellimicrobium aerolatum]|uniref:Beta-glucosidase n=1 Tax=Rubellimicrobium aerolatum TaxID=490979 RepID=A0ABW0S929_9RHOB|nr:hypothetical protein [Rubellimicrobium aerolatum]MBP1804803.1 hypothetical protein [Rubellimicrobium aerolatum]
MLLVPARLGDAAADRDLLRFVRSLPRERYRLGAIPCARGAGDPGPTLDRLRGLGVEVDDAPFGLSLEDTVELLVRALPRWDAVAPWGEAPDLPMALARMALHPPVIDGAPGVGDWERRIARALAGVAPAPAPSLFASVMQGGWECSTHVRRDGRRLDVIAATGHDLHAEADYRQLGALGLRTQRDGLRWHLIETAPETYDFASWTPMLEAARRTGTQVIWDLLHYGWPEGLDIWGPEFVGRFAAFARAAALHRRAVADEAPFWCPVNEMSFHAWAGGDVGYLNPFGRGRGFELKCQLAAAAIAAMRELRAVDPRARFVHCEPLIAVHPDPATPASRTDAERQTGYQFQAFDLIAGRLWPMLGGREGFLDVLGVNYYWNNQRLWTGEEIDVDHPSHVPLSDLLFGLHARYGRPLLIAETGVEGDRRAAWFRHVAAEVGRARARGVPVEGICLYPIANHPGWDDDRDCPNGLLGAHPGPRGRAVHGSLAQAVLEAQEPGAARRRAAG